MADHAHGQDGRQGKRGRPALGVLIVSVGLMLIALAGLMMWQGESSPPDYAGMSQTASHRQITGSGGGKRGVPSSPDSGTVPTENPANLRPATRSAD